MFLAHGVEKVNNDRCNLGKFRTSSKLLVFYHSPAPKGRNLNSLICEVLYVQTIPYKLRIFVQSFLFQSSAELCLQAAL